MKHRTPLFFQPTKRYLGRLILTKNPENQGKIMSLISRMMRSLTNCSLLKMSTNTNSLSINELNKIQKSIDPRVNLYFMQTN
ncbi:hypothetical protein MJO28_017357 [Puccinia striiformis f. sp. tritici]|nr:hypothetical protein MJO28_017357 [Puccinia striiformis f. sp. tritici]